MNKITQSSNRKTPLSFWSTKRAYIAPLSSLSSALLPGLGQYLNGETIKAVTHLGMYGALMLGNNLLLRIYPSQDSWSQFIIVMFILGAFFSFIFYTARDAYYGVPNDTQLELT
jgi:hypothetical protein